MSNVYIKTVEGGEDTSPALTDAVELDNGSTSQWTLLSAIYTLFKTSLDLLYVALAGDQTVAGVKTFTSFPITPSSAPTTNYQTANKKYVDDNAVFLSGNQTVAGVKTFSSDPIIPDEAYSAADWNGSLEPPTKNAVRDKIESMSGSTSKIVQVVATQNSAVDTSTTTVPIDDTIPTSSEGEENTNLATTITPTSATNILEIEVLMYIAGSAALIIIGALFQDAGAAAIATGSSTSPGADYVLPFTLRYRMVAGTTSATTFKPAMGHTPVERLL